MHAFVLAAGEGSRLRPYTADRPKPMIEIGGRPILDHNLRLLARHGITKAFINLHYHPEAITAYVGNGERWNIAITYLDEPVLRGTAGALLGAAETLRETFVLLYGDNLTDCDLGKLLARHRAARASATMALFRRPDAAASGIALTDAADRIIRFVEKPDRSEIFSEWVNAGVLAFEPEVLRFVEQDHPSDIGRDLIPALIAAGRTVAAYRMSERLWWVDSVEDYRRTSDAFASGDITLP